MGSGNWLKTILNSKKVKLGSSKHVKGSSGPAKSSGGKWKKRSGKESSIFAKAPLGMPVEDVAAIRIQTAFRAYRARKKLRCLKGTRRLQAVTLRPSVKKQTVSALSCLHTWNKLHSEIRDRRLCMVKEGRLRQKKLENQQKLEAKLHDLEVEWHSGSEPMDVILSRIHQREEAAVKRERALAYAFSHQWRANSNPLGLSNYELRKAEWGWSWKERWIAARPWESRVPPKFITPKKEQRNQQTKVGKNKSSPATPKSSTSDRSKASEASTPNGKGTAKPRRLSYPGAEKPSSHSRPTKPEVASTKKNTKAEKPSPKKDTKTEEASTEKHSEVEKSSPKKNTITEEPSSEQRTKAEETSPKKDTITEVASSEKEKQVP